MVGKPTAPMHHDPLISKSVDSCKKGKHIVYNFETERQGDMLNQVW